MRSEDISSFLTGKISELNGIFRSLECFQESFNLVNLTIQPHVMHINKESAGTISLPEDKSHSHRTFEISLLLDGRMKYQLEGQEILVSANDLIVIPPDISHHWIVTRDAVIFSIMLFIQQHGNDARKNMNKFKKSIFKHGYVLHNFTRITSECDEIINEALRQETGFDEKIQCFTREIYTDIIRKLLPDISTEFRNSGTPPKRGNMNVSVVELIRYYIQDNLSRKIRMRNISAYLGMSINKMCNIFKQEQGMTIQKYVTKNRIETSCNLLLNSDRILKDIASVVGYEDVDYFCRVFHKQMGMTPTQYRRSNG